MQSYGLIFCGLKDLYCIGLHTKNLSDWTKFEQMGAFLKFGPKWPNLAVLLCFVFVLLSKNIYLQMFAMSDCFAQMFVPGYQKNPNSI